MEVPGILLFSYIFYTRAVAYLRAFPTYAPAVLQRRDRFFRFDQIIALEAFDLPCIAGGG